MTATWRQVARKDFEDAARSRVLWGLSAVFVAFLVMSLLSAEQLFPERVTVDASVALTGVSMLAQLFVPGVALAAGYMAVAGERQSGSLRVLLAYPFSRTSVVAGKLVGRSLVTVTALAVGFVVASGLVALRYGLPDAVTYAQWLGSGVLLALAFTGIAVGGSAAAATRGRAMALTIGSFVAMVFFWKPVAVGVYYAANGSLPGVRVDTWYLLLERLNPLAAYRELAGGTLGHYVQAVPRLPLEDVPADAPQGLLATSNRVAGEVPCYLQDWAAAVVLVAWGVVPLLLGVRYFERADLG